MIRFIFFVFVVGAVCFGAFWFLTRPSAEAGPLPAYTPNADNGRQMFFAGGCASCHATPQQGDPLRLGGGLPLKSPFGTFHVPNISSDNADGIGAWTEEQFVTALTKGVSPSGEHLYPSFPYTSYQRARLEDVRDLFAFLKTVPAVQGRAPAHELPFPFNMRRGLGLWKILYVDGQRFAPDPGQPAEWNRGAYLVESFGHCAECHSSRDPLGGINPGQRFAGAPNPEGEGWIPNITQAALKDWSVDDFVDLLTTGTTPNGTVAGSMREVVKNTAQITDGDRRAMAVYLKSLPPVQGPKPPAP